MTDDNNPGEGTVADGTLDGAVNALADLPDDSDDFPNTDAEETDDAGEPETDDVDADDPEGDEAETDDEEGDDPEDSDEDEPEGSDDEPEDTGGKFVGNNARVKLADGTTTTVEELKNGYLRQSDYTRKRQEDAEKAKALDAKFERVNQTDQELSTRLETMSSMLEQWKPQPPTTSYDEDPMAFGKYQADLQTWQAWEGELNKVRQEQEERREAEFQERQKEYLQQQKAELLQHLPHLGTPEKFKSFMGEAQKVMERFGFTAEELQGAADHRLYRVMDELIKAERAKAKAPDTRKRLERKPKMVKGNRRSNDKGRQARQSRADRLRETGSVNDAVAVLRGLD